MKTLTKFTFLCSLLLIVSACGKEDEFLQTAALGETIELKIGAQVTISDINYIINFLDITEDSRCPTSETCFWEGQAVAKFSLNIDGASQEMELVSRSSAPQEAQKTIGERTIRMASVDPEPVTNTPIEKAAYSITLVVE